ncbi:MAG: hypothetical protein KDC18_17130 [Alphaproteobacteria bacterium]|nr:hypothetical protein [Alphaproteobacteria bacterium]
MSSRDADPGLTAIVAELSGLVPRARRTITHDNGGEFARHGDLTEQIGLRAFFWDPYRP